MIKSSNCIAVKLAIFDSRILWLPNLAGPNHSGELSKQYLAICGPHISETPKMTSFTVICI